MSNYHSEEARRNHRLSEKKRNDRIRRELCEKQGFSFVCGVNGCTEPYPSENGVAQHRREAHGIRGRRHTEMVRRYAADQPALDKLRSRVVRGNNIDSSGILEFFLSAPRRTA